MKDLNVRVLDGEMFVEPEPPLTYAEARRLFSHIVGPTRGRDEADLEAIAHLERIAYPPIWVTATQPDVPPTIEEVA